MATVVVVVGVEKEGVDEKKTLPTTELFVDGGSFVSLPLSEQQLTSRVLLPSSSSSSFVSIACVVLYTGSKRKEYKRKQGVKKEGKKESMEKSKKRDGMENNPFLSLSLYFSLLSTACPSVRPAAVPRTLPAAAPCPSR